VSAKFAAYENSEFTRAITLHTVPGTVNDVHERIRLAAAQFVDVGVINDRRRSPSHQREWTRQSLNHLPHTSSDVGP
jgi:hypothetical protein